MATEAITTLLKQEIKHLQDVLALLENGSVLTDSIPSSIERTPPTPAKTKRVLSAEGREKIRAAMKKRWARSKREKKTTQA